jgi:hypothetical protein
MSLPAVSTAPVVAATTVVSDQVWTVDDLERMPSGYRYELLDGVLYKTAMPAWPHPLVVKNLFNTLDDWVRSRGSGYVLTPQTGLQLNRINYLDPDVVYVRPDQVPRKRGQRITSAAFAAEVLSPSNRLASLEEREARFLRWAWKRSGTRITRLARWRSAGAPATATSPPNSFARPRPLPRSCSRACRFRWMHSGPVSRTKL